MNYNHRPEPDAIPILSRVVRGGATRTSRTELVAYTARGGHICNVKGVRGVWNALERLLAFPAHAQEVAGAVAEGPWDNDQLFVFAMILEHLRMDGGFKTTPAAAKNNPVALALLTALHAKAPEGDGELSLRKLLVQGGVLKKSVLKAEDRLSLPARLPSNINGALKLRAKLQVTGQELAFGEPATDDELSHVVALPSVLRQFLALHNGMDQGQIVPARELGALNQSFAKKFKDLRAEAAAEDPVEEDDTGRIDLRDAGPIEQCYAFGRADNGDVFFLSVTQGSHSEPAVIRLVHDEAGVAIRTSRTLGEFIALQLAEAFSRRIGRGDGLDRLEAQARAPRPKRRGS